ncbi:MAG: N-acetyltransferase [Candidatus Hydrogenedentota bacterium]|nr:MAG: N-acetyltransferase [Candidatus Hydrogenedentota bacterium]
MLQNVKVRPEQPGDVEAISRITELAFRSCPYGNHTEQYIIEELRRSDALSISLVAEVDTQIVGHIAFSPVEISDGSKNWYALGPVSVTPKSQGQGIGKALINTGLDVLRTLEAEGCVLVGEPSFYTRFGFRNCPNLTFDGVPQGYVQSFSFGKHSASGRVIHHPAFNAKG